MQVEMLLKFNIPHTATVLQVQTLLWTVGAESLEIRIDAITRARLRLAGLRRWSDCGVEARYDRTSIRLADGTTVDQFELEVVGDVPAKQLAYFSRLLSQLENSTLLSLY